MINKTIYRVTSLISLSAALWLALAVGASAHVTVSPAESAPGAWETYSIKIPTEKELDTVKVTLKIPAGAEFKQYRPVPGWNVELAKDEAGAVTAVTWSAEAEGIGPGEFQQFDFVAKNPGDAAELAWDAYQYYSDGSVVEWTGGEGADKPHSLTVLRAGAAEGAGAEAAGHSHGGEGNAPAGEAAGAVSGGTGSAGAAEAAVPQRTGAGWAGPAALALAAAALIAALAALIVALRSARRASRR